MKDDKIVCLEIIAGTILITDGLSKANKIGTTKLFSKCLKIFEMLSTFMEDDKE